MSRHRTFLFSKFWTVYYMYFVLELNTKHSKLDTIHIKKARRNITLFDELLLYPLTYSFISLIVSVFPFEVYFNKYTPLMKFEKSILKL